jgi:stalled ribosome alternative rescue factor ArfA
MYEKERALLNESLLRERNCKKKRGKGGARRE